MREWKKRGLEPFWPLPEPYRTIAIGLLLMALVAILGVLR